MQFRIADTFTHSLARLTGEEQKAAKTSAFDLQVNPAGPGLQFHKLDKVKDRNFWSVRVSRDIRIIVHKTADDILLCYVDHHDKAYAWAERRKLETHPRTGAAQLVEIREVIQEILVPVRVTAAPAIAPKPALFADRSNDELLSYGVPPEWLDEVRGANEDSLLTITDHLPAEAAEALLEFATGGRPRVLAATVASPFQHPDALRRFRIVENVEELERALDYPWDKWTIFLHPEQRDWVQRDYNGPARVAGSAGTGKTIVAVHRAVHLARPHTDARVLLATFSEPLAQALRIKLRRLIGNEPKLAERINVHALDAVGLRLYRQRLGPVTLPQRSQLIEVLRSAARNAPNHKFSVRFLIEEWEQIVDAWQLTDWPSYRDVARLGRKTRLAETQRRALWSIFEQVLEGLRQANATTLDAVFTRLAAALSGALNPPFDFAVIDEAQDLTVAQLKFLAALGGGRPNALFFAGDLGQRIFQQPFSWKSLGVDVRGRSWTLRVNYRTSHQIRAQADRLLAPELTDVDGIAERRSDTVSVFNGPEPTVQMLTTESAEIAAVAEWLKQRSADGLQPHELAVFVRSSVELPRAQAAAKAAGIPFKTLDEDVDTAHGHLSLCTMHVAKGLEFRGVAVMACEDEVIPSQQRIESVGDEADLEEIYDTERHLLYVACTRARDQLLVTSAGPASEFLDDLRSF